MAHDPYMPKRGVDISHIELNPTAPDRYKRAAGELNPEVVAVLSATYRAPRNPQAMVLDALKIGRVRMEAKRDTVGRDQVTADIIPVVFRDKQIRVLEDAHTPVDETFIPPIDINQYNVLEPNYNLPEFLAEPPDGTKMLVMRGSNPATRNNHILLPGETYIVSEAINKNDGRRKSTRFVELLDRQTNQNMVSGFHHSTVGIFSPFAYLQEIGGPDDVPADPLLNGGGQVNGLNGLFGEPPFVDPAKSKTGSAMVHQKNSSYCGESRFVAGLELGASNLIQGEETPQNTGDVLVSTDAGTANISNVVSVSSTQTTPPTPPATQMPPLGGRAKHPVFGGSLPDPLLIDPSAPARSVAHITAGPRLPNTSGYMALRTANSGPIIADGARCQHSVLITDPETGIATVEGPGHISTNAFYKFPGTDGNYFDAPETYHKRDLLEPTKGFTPVRSFKAIDPNVKHLHEGIEHDNAWDREVHIPVRSAPPMDDIDPDKIPGYFVGEPIEPGKGGGGGGGGGNPGGGGGPAGGGVGAGGSSGDGKVLPIRVDWGRVAEYWETYGLALAEHGTQFITSVEALGYDIIAVPLTGPNANKLNRHRMPSAYDIDELELYDSLPIGLATFGFYQADSSGQPVLATYDVRLDAVKQRRRARTAEYKYPTEFNPYTGEMTGTATPQSLGRHPTVVEKIGIPYPETEDLIRDGWWQYQDGDTGHYHFKFVDSDGSTDVTKNLYINGKIVGGETNTASNVGTGDGWFKQKDGTDLEFKSFLTGIGLSTTSNTNDLTLGLEAGLASIAAITGAANKLLGWSDDNVAINYDISATGVTLIADATAADMRTTLGLGGLAVRDDIDTAQLVNASVTLAKLAAMATDSFIGRDTAGTGAPEILSASTARIILNIEDGADVTDATNVASAGAVMDGDFSTNGIMRRTGPGTYDILTDSSSDWDTAYGWGDHASAGYITGITGEPLSDLSDVTITSIADGEILRWNGSAWINNTLDELGVGDIAQYDSVPAALAADGTIVPVVSGGTGSGTAAGARTNLGVAIGSDVQIYMPTASQVEMEAGTETNLRAMSPKLVADAVAAQTSGGLEQVEVTAPGTMPMAANKAYTVNILSNGSGDPLMLDMPDPASSELGDVIIVHVKAMAGGDLMPEVTVKINPINYRILSDGNTSDIGEITLFDTTHPLNDVGAFYKFENAGTGWHLCCPWGPLIVA